MRFAASITRFTRSGADAGAIALPSTIIALSGGGRGGTNAVPPLLAGVVLPPSAQALPAPTSEARHAHTSAVWQMGFPGELNGISLVRLRG